MTIGHRTEFITPDLEGVAGDEMFANTIAHFADCCQGRCQPLCDGRDHLRTMQLIWSIYASARRGIPVEVNSCESVLCTS